MKRGKLITFEGIDGCGKTTQFRLLEKYLRERDLGFISTREPGGTELGRKIRSVLLDGGKGSVDPVAELLLYTADRAHHVRRVILPALEAGKIVLSDRFYDATTVYQGYARGFDLGLVKQLNELATCGLKPDLTLLFDLDVEVALRRTQKRIDDVTGAASQPDRLDSEPLEFHQRVRQAYLEIATLEPQRFRIIPAGGSIEETYKLMMRQVEERIRKLR
ncbi:MAG: dTMP kinase [Acidobacteria bacterium]|nr:dTMP kinase [Acidobacteriota bacterium]MCI0663010.1 dTMP kinase [Acidobacteriota bacterium]